MAMPLTQKNSASQQTYAQNLWYGNSSSSFFFTRHYQTHSKPKLLIHIETFKCLFAGHSDQVLDLQGSGAVCNKLSTKLSTENRDNFKTVKNQGLSARPGCAFNGWRGFRRFL
ncbi:MAG: hypothetical protein H7273_08030 [Polaromonas sp.]|nr:hypothetical protein [Polaromonas sp.]